MKILLVNYGFPPLQIGGAETYTHDAAAELACQGHEVTVIATGLPSLDNSLRVAREKLNHFQLLRLSLPQDKLNRYAVDPALQTWTRDYLRHSRPDILYVGMYWYLVGLLQVAHEAGIPLFHVAHSYDLHCPRVNRIRVDNLICREATNWRRCVPCLMGLFGNGKGSVIGVDLLVFIASNTLIRKAMARVSCRGGLLAEAVQTYSDFQRMSKFLSMSCRTISCLSRDSLELHRRFGSKTAPFCSLPNGIDTRKFAAIPCKERNASVVFTFIGRIDMHKGLDTAIQAFNEIPPSLSTYLRIYGDTEAPEYRTVAAKLMQMAEGNPRIEFRGKVTGEALLSAYAECDVFLLPSKTEIQPLTIQEALASQRPVLCTAVGGNTELIKDGVNGFTFSPGDVNALKHHVENIVKNPDLLATLSTNAKPYVDIHDTITILEKHFDSSLREKR